MQLLGDLIDRMQRSVERQRDPRKRLVVSRPDCEGVDVEPAPGEQAGDPCQDTGLVLDQDREDVLTAGSQADGGLELVEGQDFLGCWFSHRPHPTMSLAGWPAGIIGIGVLLAGDPDVDEHRAFGRERFLDVAD